MFKWIASALVAVITVLMGFVLNGISGDITRIEQHLGVMNGDVKVTRSQVAAHEKRLDHLEQVRQ